jgi:hypothetical protein
MIGRLGVAFCSLGVFVALVVSAEAADVTINITGDRQFVVDGQTQQFPVVVGIGQSIRWINKDAAPHTATSDINKSGSAGVAVFATGQIAAGQASVDITITQGIYDEVRQASNVTTPLAHLGYFCSNHPEEMGGNLVLVPQDQLARIKAQLKAHMKPKD